jgi:hypothetical protein
VIAFSGYCDQYAEQPIAVKTGETIAFVLGATGVLATGHLESRPGH